MNGNDSILSRTLLYRRLPRREGPSASFELMDFCLVNTTLGAMIEPRTLIRANGAMVNQDVYDGAFTDIKEADEQTLAAVGFAGTQWPRTYNAL